MMYKSETVDVSKDKVRVRSKGMPRNLFRVWSGWGLIIKGECIGKKLRFIKSEVHGGLPNLDTVVSASKRRGGALYKFPK